MKNTLLKSTLAVAAVFGMANVANADIDNKDNAKAGEIYRWETNATEEYTQLLEPADGVYIVKTHSNDSDPWSSQFFIVFSDENLPAGTNVELSFEYKCEGDSVTFNAQGHANPHTYVNNDGWADLSAGPEDDWKEYSGIVALTGDIRTFAVNASIAKKDATLMLRNILISVDGDDLIDTKSLVKTAVNEDAAVAAFVAGDVLFASEAANIVVYNINGVAVLSANNATSLDLANLKAGLYIAKVGDKAIKFAK